MHRGEQVVQEVGRRAPVSGEADDAVGGEVRAVVGDGVEQAGAAGARGAGETYGTPARQQADEPLALLLALQERQSGPGGSRRYGRQGGAGQFGALGRAELRGPLRSLSRRADLYLTAVDRVDGEQEVARDELDGTGECGCVLAQVGGERITWRARARRLAVVVMAVLFGSPVVRVHVPSPPKASCADLVAGSPVTPRPLPALLHTALSLLVRCPPVGFRVAGSRTLNLRTVSPTGRGTAPPETSQSREDCARGTFSYAVSGRVRRVTPGAVTRLRCRPRSRGSGAVGWPPADAASVVVRRAARAVGRTARPFGGPP